MLFYVHYGFKTFRISRFEDVQNYKKYPCHQGPSSIQGIQQVLAQVFSVINHERLIRGSGGQGRVGCGACDCFLSVIIIRFISAVAIISCAAYGIGIVGGSVFIVGAYVIRLILLLLILLLVFY